MKEFNQLDILINTAGAVLKKPFVDITEEEYDHMFAINAIFNTFYLSQIKHIHHHLIFILERNLSEQFNASSILAPILHHYYY
jgi:NAD(P)-dependent dehydrogenase (short-subunit alcohol dehydrogenase family)